MTVHESALRNATILAVRAWADSLPAGSVRLKETAAPHEYVIEVIPRNERAAVVMFRVSEYGTFGLYVGSGIRVEDLPLSESYVLEICDAVRRGKLEEESWRRRGKIVKVRNVLHLPSGDLYGTELRGVLAGSRTDEHEKQHYEPY